MTETAKAKEEKMYGRSKKLMRQAERALAGGVGSNFRKLEKPVPLYFDRGQGAYLWDVDGNRYIDFALGQGPLVLGHCHSEWVEAISDQLKKGQIWAGQSKLEIELSELIKSIIPGAGLMRYGNSSSEINQLALRIARAKTGRNRFIKMEGHYLGWYDNILASVHPNEQQAGDYDRPQVVLPSAGQDPKVAEDILVTHFNDTEHLKKLFTDYPNEIAAVIMEPVMCNSGCIIPKETYLAEVRALCNEYGAVLIYDETITGFRIALGGATERFGVTPDLWIFGKGLGGGIPVSCLVGTEEIMQCVCDYSVFHAGTFNTNLAALSGALATLRILAAEKNKVYQIWDELGDKLRFGLRDLSTKHEVNLVVKGIGQVTYTGFFDDERMDTYRDCWRIETDKIEMWDSQLKKHGIRIISRGLWYLSTAHTAADIDEALSVADNVLHVMSQDVK